jgi:hypothetical protein
MAGSQPLFAQERRSSATSDERAAREDDALLGNQRDNSETKMRSRAGFWREVGVFIWALLATAAVIVLAVVLQHQGKSPTQDGKTKKPTGKRNLIFMVSDGSLCSHPVSRLKSKADLELLLQWDQPVSPLPDRSDNIKAVCQRMTFLSSINTS